MNLKQLLGVKSKQPIGGRYKLLQPLGQGGFGHTFLATDLHLPNHPTCVIKQLKPHVQDRENLVTARRLFETEARVLYQLGEHNQIPRLLAHFEDRQEFYLAQELIEGKSLATLIQPGQPWSEAKVQHLLLDILTPLAFVHGKGVIHRDLKPANLIRRRADGHMVLIDFGAVKQVSERRIRLNQQQVSQTIAIGTQGYMPNEQLAGTPWFSSDLYAVGMICLQALTGMAPHLLRRDPLTSEILWQNSDLAISEPFKAVLSRMVRYDFRERYPTAKEALADLQALSRSQIATMVPGDAPIEEITEIVAATPSPTAPEKETLGQTISLKEPLQAQSTAVVERLELPVTNSPQVKTATATVKQPERSTLTTFSHARITASPELTSPQRRIPWSTLGLSLLTITALGFLPSRQMSSNLAAQSVDQVMATQRPAAETVVAVPWETPTTELPTHPAPGSVTPAPPAVVPPLEKTPEETRGFQVQPTASESPAVLLARANDLRRQQRYEEALQMYDQIVADPSEQVEGHWGQCYSLNQLQAYDRAIEACDRALTLDPDHIQSLWSKGYALEQQGNPEAALELYDSTLALDPGHTAAWNNRGGILLKQQQFAAALEAFDQARELDPEFAEAWSNRGAALWSLGQAEDAIASIETALELQPDYPAAQALRDQMQQKLGR